MVKDTVAGMELTAARKVGAVALIGALAAAAGAVGSFAAKLLGGGGQ